MQERGTQQGRVRARSYYVKATTHPRTTAVLGAGALAVSALGYSALRRPSSRR